VFPGAQLLVTMMRKNTQRKIMESFLNFIHSSSLNAFPKILFFPRNGYTTGNIRCQNKRSNSTKQLAVLLSQSIDWP
jgi:hypothetical protein